MYTIGDRMKKKGFTLVEMLATVAVLGIVILIVAPNITGTLKKVNDDKYQRFLSDVFIATEAYIQAHIDEYPEIGNENERVYVYFTDLISGHYLKSDVYDPKGKKSVSEELDYTVEVYLSDGEYKYKLYEKRMPTYQVISGDINTIGSVVRIINEEFYVIGQEDSTHVKLLAKWNLNVGNNPKGTATGLQDENVKGDTTRDPVYGTVAYSSSDYWHDEANQKLKDEYGGYTYSNVSHHEGYVDEHGDHIYPVIYTTAKENGVYLASIVQYVEDYVDYFANHGLTVTGRLFTMSDYAEVVTYYDDLYDSGLYSSNDWINQTSYWMGDSWGPEYVSAMDGYDWSVGAPYYSDAYGVRPVIIIEK